MVRWTQDWPWDSLSGIRNLQREMNRLFSDYDGTAEPAAFPAINMWSGKEDVVVGAEIPGVDPGRIDLSVLGDTLTIRGERKSEDLNNGSVCHRQERAFGEFMRTVELPFPVESDRTQAEYKNGVLWVTLQKAPAAKARQIAVKSK